MEPTARRAAIQGAIVALQSLMSRAMAGDRTAQCDVAEIWLVLLQVPDIARSWYREAALQGCKKSAFRLALFHCYSRTHAFDPLESLYWCIIAAANGHESARSVYLGLRAMVSETTVVELQHRLARTRLSTPDGTPADQRSRRLSA